MQLSTWIEINKLKLNEAAALFDVSRAHIYKYLYDSTIPKPFIMTKIFISTAGLVSANDFYGTTPALLEEELCKRFIVRKGISSKILLTSPCEGLRMKG